MVLKWLKIALNCEQITPRFIFNIKTVKMKLKLQNNVSKTEYEFTVTDQNSSTLFYTFEISLPSGVIDGEYSYYLTDKGKTIAQGVCQIGDYNPEDTKTYKEENKTTYKQYNG